MWCVHSCVRTRARARVYVCTYNNLFLQCIYFNQLEIKKKVKRKKAECKK